MRLTLRTLLAYLDDSLEPGDAQEIGQKIEASEFAADLVQRIRNSVRRERLGAPKLTGKGLGLDANSVAEYLDSVLPPDRVGEYEKICLESDIHLAEAAACHQILTLVFVEPAPTELVSRERMYRLEQASLVRTTPPVTTAAAVMAAAASSRVAESSAPPQVGAAAGNGDPAAADRRAAADSLASAPLASEVDEEDAYDAEDDAPRARSRYADTPEGQHRSIWPVIGALAAGFFITLLGLRAMGRIGPSHPLLRLFDSRPVSVAANAEDGKPVRKATAANEGARRTRRAAAETNAAGAEKRSSSAGKKQPAAIVDAGVVTDSTLPAVNSTGGAASPAGDVPSEAPPPPPTLDEAAAASDAPGEGEVEDAGPTPTPFVVGAEVGTHVTEAQLLVKYDEAKSGWVRTPTGAVVSSAENLVALPQYRPQIALNSGLTATLVGPATFRFDSTADGQLRLTIDDGAAILSTTEGRAETGKPLELNLAGHVGVVEFENLATRLAVAVQRAFVPGADPAVDPSPLTVELLALGGAIQWRTLEPAPAANPSAGSSHEAIVVREGEKLVFHDALPGQVVPAEHSPNWVSPAEDRALEQMAAVTLESLIPSDRAVVLSLQEQVGYRQVEVGSLAAQSLGYLDEFDSFLATLQRDDQKSNWDAQIASLRMALARSPQSANRVRASLEKQRSDDAERLYRMLCGYNQRQLESGGALELVKGLEDENLDVRVLSIKNLEQITGMTQSYRPELSAARRHTGIKRWRERLEAGAIRYPTEADGSKAPGRRAGAAADAKPGERGVNQEGGPKREGGVKRESATTEPLSPESGEKAADAKLPAEPKAP